MSAIQTLPFGLDESPVGGSNNFEDLLGQTYINAQGKPGLYRLFKWTGGDQAAAALRGVFLTASALTAPFEVDTIGALTANTTFAGATPKALTKPVLDNEYVLLAVDGVFKVLDNAVPLTVGQLCDALIAAGTAGPAGGTTCIVREAVDADGFVTLEYLLKNVQSSV